MRSRVRFMISRTSSRVSRFIAIVLLLGRVRRRRRRIFRETSGSSPSAAVTSSESASPSSSPSRASSSRSSSSRSSASLIGTSPWGWAARVTALQQIFGAPRGAGETEVVSPGRNESPRQVTELHDERIARSPPLGHVLRELATRVRLELLLILVELDEELRQVLVDALDEIRVEQELPLDLLDRVAVEHVLLDGVDPAHDLGRVDAERALVLALAADALAPRQEALLHVLAEARLGQLHAPARERVHDLNNRLVFWFCCF